MPVNGEMSPEEVLDEYAKLKVQVRLLVAITRANLATDYLGPKVRGILDQVKRVEELL